jgi:biopolymer transport protein ExbD
MGEHSEVGSESFIDVMANLVGILIVLLALVALRVQSWEPRSETAAQAFPAEPKVVRLSGEEMLQREAEERSQRLDALRAQLNQLQEDLRRIITEQRALEEELQRLSEQLRVLEAASRDTPQQVTAHRGPTATVPKRDLQIRPLVLKAPVSRPVPEEANVVHFEIRRGRVTFLDLDTLLELARHQAQQWPPAPGALAEPVGQVGPVGSFALRFRAAAEPISLAEQVYLGRSTTRYLVIEWRAVPLEEARGEPVEKALQPDSRFWSILRSLSPQQTFVTLWTYDDSFAAFRQLRDALYERGFYVAARPLPEGVPISGSARGSRSYAQ